MVIDGCGIGAAPDAAIFGDQPTCNSLANTARRLGGLSLPALEKLGLGKIAAIDGLNKNSKTNGLFGKLRERSNGKDTQTGHWEMMGVVSSKAFPLYPEGFPKEVIDEFIEKTGCRGILCNKPASGTDVLDELGDEHSRTGYPIVYTSGDSVFQIATNVDVIPLATLYKWCEIARDILQGPHRVGRVIARPFRRDQGHSGGAGNGESGGRGGRDSSGKGGSDARGNGADSASISGAHGSSGSSSGSVGSSSCDKGRYKRLSGERRDYAVPPPEATLLDRVKATGYGVLGIGKIEDIFVGHGLTHARHTGSNQEGLELTLKAIERELDLNEMIVHSRKMSSSELAGNEMSIRSSEVYSNGMSVRASDSYSSDIQMNNEVQLIFTNLVDTDSLYGHRRDVPGYGKALTEIDCWTSKIIDAMNDEDLLLISSDHGNDPTAPGTDHTREYVPLLAYSPIISKQAKDSGDFGDFGDFGNFGERDGFVDIAATLASWLGVEWNGLGKSVIATVPK